MSFSKSWNCTPRSGSCIFSFLKNSLVQINSKLNSKPYDYLYLYRHTNAGVFDDFPKISEDSRELVLRLQECCRTFSESSEDYRRLPRTFEEDPKMFRWYINEFRNTLSDKPDIRESSISSLVRIWKIRHSSPGCGFVWILRVVYFPVKHSCLYNKYNMSSAFAAKFYCYLQPSRLIAKFAFVKVLTRTLLGSRR